MVVVAQTVVAGARLLDRPWNMVDVLVLFHVKGFILHELLFVAWLQWPVGGGGKRRCTGTFAVECS